MTPLVSVCIPVFNGLPFVEATIRSVLDQGIEALEIVVSDNCSTDGTFEAVSAIGDPRIRLLRNDRNIGAIANWNRVIAEARGRYVKLLPADDLLYPGSLRSQVAVLEDGDLAGVVLVAGRRDIIDAGGRVVLRGRGLPRLRGVVPGAEAVRRCARAGTNLLGEPAAVLVRGDVLRSCTPVTGDPPYMVDLELWCCVLERGDLFALGDTVAAFRLAPGSESVAAARTQAAQAGRFFRSLHARSPSVVRRRDLAVGRARATALAWARRGAYTALRVAGR